MERISGPYKGYFIAAYTVDSGGLFTGYAKICPESPPSVWDCGEVQRLVSVAGLREELEAIAAAERSAREAIGEIVGNDPVTAPGELS